MKKNTIKNARMVEQRYSSNYYLATLFLPRSIKEAVFVLYAFVRIPDELVDNPEPGSDPETALQAWREDWERCYYHNESKNEIMVATREIFKTYDIPFSHSEEFIAAMIQDIATNRYQTYSKLQTYIRGSADVVGLMLVKIFGCASEKATAPATKLGEAMQLTNILRDVGEDWRDRNRIYLPLDDMRAFVVSEADIEKKVVSAEFKALMKYYIQKAHGLFAEANEGITLLPKPTQRAVRLASAFYEELLDRIEDNQYDVLSKKAKHSFIQKCRIICNEYVR